MKDNCIHVDLELPVIYLLYNHPYKLQVIKMYRE